MNPKTGLSALALAGALVSLLPAAANASLLMPNTTADENSPGGACSLREAITAAQGIGSYNGCPPFGVPLNEDADTIVLQSGQTYTLGGTGLNGGGEDANATGDLDVVADTGDQYLTIQTSGAEPATIDANGAVSGDRVLDLDPASVPSLAQVTLTNLIITGGVASSGGGGGINVTTGDLVLSGTRIQGNTATNAGGGVRLASTAASAAAFTDSSIEGNTAAIGGGVFQATGNLTLTRSTISGNSAIDAQGDGGGLFTSVNDLTATLVSSTVSGNLATGSGGGIYMENQGAALSLRNATLAGNTADSDAAGGGDGGGLYRDPGTATVDSRNSLIGDNSDLSGGAPDCSADGGVTSGGHNLVEDGTGCTGFTGSGDLVGSNPFLGPLASNGGATQTQALLGPQSAAIDAGDPGTPGSGAPACETTDQRGLPRYDECDIGAFELQGQPPLLAPVGDRTVQAGSTLAFSLSATDPNPGDSATFSGSNLPSGATVSPAGLFSWTPTAAQVGSHPGVVMEVTDSLATDSESIALTVTAASAPTSPKKKCKKGRKLKKVNGKKKCVKKRKKRK